MIRKEEVVYIGRITKYRGIDGEVELSFVDDIFDRTGAEYLVLQFDGILIPFFWEEYRFKNDSVAIFKFEDIDDEKDAKRLVGADVYYPVSYIGEEDSQPASWTFFMGFKVYDKSEGLLGEIKDVDDSSANILFYITPPEGGELIIPFHPDLLISHDNKKREMMVALPEGLLALNK